MSPSPDGGEEDISRLSEGLRSLFYLSLIQCVFQIEEKILNGDPESHGFSNEHLRHEIRKQSKQLVHDFMNSNNKCNVSGIGMKQAEIFPIMTHHDSCRIALLQAISEEIIATTACLRALNGFWLS